MNWFRLRISFWTILIIAIVATLEWDIIGWLKSPFSDLFLTIEAVLVAEMALYELMRKRESVELKMTASIRGEDFGI